jgi:uncharacterized protein YgbK (DUF1537 family)
VTLARGKVTTSRSGTTTPAVLALSDDLTGAAALASELRAAGLLARVSQWSATVSEPSSVQALVLDTGTRCLSAEQAGERVVCALRSFDAPALGRYHRIDSTLRGNIEAELTALSSWLECSLVMAPAAPSLGISTSHGVQLARGKPIDATHFGRRLDGVRTSRLWEMLPRCAVLCLDEVRGCGLPGRLTALVRDRMHVVCDATTEEDLIRIGSALAAPDLSGLAIPVGSYGLARSWAAVLGREVAGRRHPVLAAVSSINPTSVRQAEIAALRGAHLTVNATDSDINGARAALRGGRDTILLAADPHRLPEKTSTVYAAQLAARVDELARSEPIAGLVLVGGDLATAFLKTTHASADVTAAPWAATALVGLVGGALDGRLAIFKSGSQGTPEWLDQACGLICAIHEQRQARHVG